MSVRISTRLLADLQAQAARSPDEICGLLFGSHDAIEAVLPCRNVAVDPRHQFEIDPAALLTAHRASRAGGAALIGCYHSHPSGLAEPSPCDAASAAADEWLWLILGNGRAQLFRATARGVVHGRFDPVAMTLA